MARATTLSPAVVMPGFPSSQSSLADPIARRAELVTDFSEKSASRITSVFVTNSSTRSRGSSHASSSSQSFEANFTSSTSSRDRKKVPSIFGSFFTVKEPSQQAFADFHRESARKTAAHRKDGRKLVTVIPGVSDTKLPSTVPRVNTKWDGVPKVLKEREKKKEKDKVREKDKEREMEKERAKQMEKERERARERERIVAHRMSMDSVSRSMNDRAHRHRGQTGMIPDAFHQSSSSMASCMSLNGSQTPSSARSSRSRLGLGEGLAKPLTSFPGVTSADSSTMPPWNALGISSPSYELDSTNSFPDYPDFSSIHSTDASANAESRHETEAFGAATVYSPYEAPYHELPHTRVSSAPLGTGSSVHPAFEPQRETVSPFPIQPERTSYYDPGEIIILHPRTSPMLGEMAAVHPEKKVKVKVKVKVVVEPFPAGEAQPMGSLPELIRTNPGGISEQPDLDSDLASSARPVLRSPLSCETIPLPRTSHYHLSPPLSLANPPPTPKLNTEIYTSLDPALTMNSPYRTMRRMNNVPAPLDLSLSTPRSTGRPIEAAKKSGSKTSSRDRSITPWDFDASSSSSRPGLSGSNTTTCHSPNTPTTPTTPNSTKALLRRTKLWGFSKSS